MKNEWRKVAADDSERDYDMNVYLTEKKSSSTNAQPQGKQIDVRTFVVVRLQKYGVLKEHLKLFLKSMVFPLPMCPRWHRRKREIRVLMLSLILFSKI